MTDHRELPHVALSRQAHDRHGVLRTDEDWLEKSWADPATRVLVISGSRLHLVDGRIEWVGSEDAPAGLRILLGERDGVQHFAVVVTPDDAPGSREEWVPLRGALRHSRPTGSPTARWCSTRSASPSGCMRRGTARAAVASSSPGRPATCCTAPTAVVTSSRAPTLR